MNTEGFRTAQMGYGFHKDGSLRLPKPGCHADMCVIDDASLPQRLPDLNALMAAAVNGCCFDFERQPSPAHKRLLEAMLPKLRGMILLPEAFSFPGALPLVRAIGLCNDWHSFVRRAKQRHPHGWALELSPCRYRRDAAVLPDAETHLNAAGYCCRVKSGVLEYYDTKSTVQAKLETAARHGCQVMIGLYEEFKDLE